MEETKLRDQTEDDALESDDKSKSISEYNQTKVAQLKRVEELSVKVEDKWFTEATEVTLIEKEDMMLSYSSGERRANYSDLKNRKMMVFKIHLPAEYLVTSIKFNFTSIEAMKMIYNIEAFSTITNNKQSFLRPLENQKIITVDSLLKYLIINLYSFASIIYIYYQPVQGIDSDGRVNKRSKNVFSYNGPLHDLNAEIQKSNFKADDLDELDKEVAMISRKSPKNQTHQTKEESKVNKQEDNDDYNTRNFNSIPRNYDDNSENSKSDNPNEDSKPKSETVVMQANVQSVQSDSKGSIITLIAICGARGMQSKINLIPLFNIKSLFQR